MATSPKRPRALWPLPFPQDVSNVLFKLLGLKPPPSANAGTKQHLSTRKEVGHTHWKDF